MKKKCETCGVVSEGKTYEVELIRSTYQFIKVVAVSEKEAARKAIELIDEKQWDDFGNNPEIGRINEGDI